MIDSKKANIYLVYKVLEIYTDAEHFLTQQELVDTVSNTYNEVKYKKTLDTSLVEDKIKNTIRKYIEKVDGSYFEVESGEDNEKKINIKDSD